MDARRRLERLAERGHPRGADEVMAAARSALDPESGDPTPVAGTAGRRIPAWVYVLGAAVAVTVLIGGAAVMFGGDEGLVATTAAGLDPVATAEAGPVWSVVPGSGDVFQSGHTPVTALAFRDGYVAAGYVEVDVPRAAVWVSADGSAWSRVGAGMGPDTRINGLATDGSLLVAGGTAFDDDPTGFDHAAVWVSSDGATWTRAVADEEVFPRASRITAVGFAGRFVALGTVPEQGDFGSEEPSSVVATWVSDDGAEWRRGAGVPGADSIADVTGGGTGLVAVGSVADGSSAGIWVSSDGEGWTRVEGLPATDPLDPACELQGLERVAAGPAGLLAAGSCRGPADEQASKVVLLTSSDGLDWSVVAQPNVEPYATGWITDVAVTEAGFRAVGIHLTDDSAGPAFWYSADGNTWVFQPDSALAQVSAPGERTQTVARSKPSDLGPDGVLAMGTLVEAGDRLVALGIGGDGGMVWVSEQR